MLRRSVDFRRALDSVLDYTVPHVLHMRGRETFDECTHFKGEAIRSSFLCFVSPVALICRRCFDYTDFNWLLQTVFRHHNRLCEQTSARWWKHRFEKRRRVNEASVRKFQLHWHWQGAFSELWLLDLLLFTVIRFVSYSCIFRSSPLRKLCRLSFGVTDRNCVIIVDSAL